MSKDKNSIFLNLWFTINRVWKCRKVDHGCKGMAKVTPGSVPQMTKEHNPKVCQPSPQYGIRKAFHQKLMQACASAGNKSTEETYRDIARGYENFTHLLLHLYL